MKPPKRLKFIRVHAGRYVCDKPYVEIRSYTKKVRIKAPGYPFIEKTFWQYDIGSKRDDGFENMKTAMEIALIALGSATAAEWDGEAPALDAAEAAHKIVGKRRRLPGAVPVERGLFDMTDGMPYVPNVEANKE